MLANPKASIYFCDEKNFRAVMLKGTMEVLTDQNSKDMIWREGDTRVLRRAVLQRPAAAFVA